ncbi:hypothetical protein [Brevibacillus reuszeri]|uniref:hypothetical protein n=1 Tax=Brevibacillus reuszeri TaxID=54915 RepID=UPI002898E81B|nr:hypothetical protein [Brevibacillus reuszeri]
MLWMVLGGIIACFLALAYVSSLMKQNRYGQPDHFSGEGLPATHTSATDTEARNANQSVDRP